MGEASSVDLNSAITSAVAQLSLSADINRRQSQIQLTADKLDELISALRR